MGLFNKIFKKKKKKDKNKNQVEISDLTNLKGIESKFSQQCLAENKRFENKNFLNNGMHNRFDLQKESHYVEKSCYSSPPQKEYSYYQQPGVFGNGLYHKQNENVHCHRYEGRVEQDRRNFEMSRPRCVTETNQRTDDENSLSYRHHHLGSNNDFCQRYDEERKYYAKAGQRFESNNTLSEPRKDLSRKMTTFDDFLTNSSNPKQVDFSSTASNVKMRPHRQRHQSGPERRSMCYHEHKDVRNFSNKCSVDDVNRPANFQQHSFSNADFPYLRPPTYEESKSNTIEKSDHSNITKDLLHEDKVQPAKIPVECGFKSYQNNYDLRGLSNSVNRKKSFSNFVGQKVLPDIPEVNHKEKLHENLKEQFYVNQNNNVANLSYNGDQFSSDKYCFQNTSKSNSGKNSCQQIIGKKKANTNEIEQKINSSRSNSEVTPFNKSNIMSTLVDSNLPTLGHKYEDPKNFNNFTHLNETPKVVQLRNEENLTEDKNFCKVNFEQLQSVCRENNFKINKKNLIGEGGLAKVFTGYNIRVENQKVVIKVSRCRREQVTVKIDGKDCLVPAEIYYHNEAKVDNQGVIQLLDFFEIEKSLHNDENKLIVIVLELFDDCVDLFTYVEDIIENRVQNFTEGDIRHIFKQVAHTVAKCHERGVCHCDIKLENLLVNRKSLEVKLIDFGSALSSRDGPTAKCLGTVVCYPPEFFRDKKVLPTQLDIWTLGLLLYLLITKQHCFSEADTKSGNFQVDMRPVENEVSEKCASLLYRILHPNPETRCTLNQILNDPWLKY